MKDNKPLADYDNPLVIETAKRLTEHETLTRKKVENIFYYVRDRIAFAFPVKGDLVKASETIKSGEGHCNTKGTLFLALCKAAGIPARVHFSLISKEIQRGLFDSVAYRIMPDKISHSWVEVEIEGAFRTIDSYINDNDFYLAGRSKLKALNWKTGYSIACAAGESSADFNIDEERFVQMDAVVDDHGIWDEPAEYYATKLYANRPSFLKLFLFRFLRIRINRKIRKMRASCAGGLCGTPVLAGNVLPSQ